MYRHFHLVRFDVTRKLILISNENIQAFTTKNIHVQGPPKSTIIILQFYDTNEAIESMKRQFRIELSRRNVTFGA